MLKLCSDAPTFLASLLQTFGGRREKPSCSTFRAVWVRGDSKRPREATAFWKHKPRWGEAPWWGQEFRAKSTGRASHA